MKQTVSVKDESFRVEEVEIFVSRYPSRYGQMKKFICRVYPGKSGQREGTIIEPIGEGVRWHMGIPEVCHHPFDRIEWRNDFYPEVSGIGDHGKCLDCGESRWRKIEYDA